MGREGLFATFNHCCTTLHLLNSIFKKGELATQLDPKRFDHLSWEYQVLSLEATGDTDLEAQMNDEGTMGWELVSSKRKDEDWITYI